MTPADTQAVVSARESLEQIAAALLTAWETEQRTASR